MDIPHGQLMFNDIKEKHYLVGLADRNNYYGCRHFELKSQEAYWKSITSLLLLFPVLQGKTRVRYLSLHRKGMNVRTGLLSRSRSCMKTKVVRNKHLSKGTH